LPISISIENLDSIYAYSASNESLGLLGNWPFIDIYITNSAFERYYYGSLSDSTAREPCKISTSLSGIECKTPEIYNSNSFIDLLGQVTGLNAYLEICLGLFSEIDRSGSNGNTGHCKQIAFSIFKNPQITEFNGVEEFKLYNGQTQFKIGADNFWKCCSLSDYSVTVGGWPGTILDTGTVTAILVRPPAGPWPTDSAEDNTASTVVLTAGDYEFTVGSIRYEDDRCDSPAEDCDGQRLRIGLGVGLGVGLFLLIVLISLIIVAVISRRRHRRRQLLREDPLHIYTGDPAFHREEESSELLEIIEADNLREKVRRSMVPISRIRIGNEIGKGNFGVVYSGTYKDNEDVVQQAAIKVVTSNSVKDKVEFLMEAVIMADFNHANVLSLLAITVDDDKPYAVIPLMEKGDLRGVVSDTNAIFRVRDLISFGLQVANGMNYLSDMKFVHRDLAARNCMVNRDNVVKVADFGLARDIFESDYYRSGDLNRPLPVKWMAPESIGSRSQRAIFTTKSDVWSFGVLMWELLTRGQKPYSNIRPQEIKSAVLDGYRLEKPPTAPNFVYKMMLACWDLEPAVRPPFAEIRDILQDYVDKSPPEYSEAMTYRPMMTEPAAVDGGATASTVIPMRELRASGIDNTYHVNSNYANDLV
jgi:tRNA A-37 threonylcarbamoyl transferase component Bud32